MLLAFELLIQLMSLILLENILILQYKKERIVSNCTRSALMLFVMVNRHGEVLYLYIQRRKAV